MNNFVDWIDVMGPIWANEKHDRYVQSLENLGTLSRWSDLRGVKSLRWKWRCLAR